ncbi:MAG: hypothetical protein R8G01_17275 [Ilumatobacteraceae bacterium]|nr:hypothetical protein [Ilumatobacteraceae bacterium]
MLRPPSAENLQRLCVAARASDCDLDRALSDVGVLPPADLTEIRDVLTRLDTEVARARNAEGHVILQVVWHAQLSALIHQDGRVQVLTNAA